MLKQVKPQERFSYRQMPLMGIFLLCATLLGSLLTFQISSPTAHAASFTNDPLVMVSVDMTQSSSCIETFRANIGTHQAITRQIACPAGTIMSAATMHRSQAITQHKAYVLLPSTQVSSAIRLQYLKQVQALNTSEQTAFRSNLIAHVVPATACGGTGSASLQYRTDGAVLNANISFSKSSDCSAAYFGDSQVNTAVPCNDDTGLIEWYTDQYAGYDWYVPQDFNVCPVGHYFHMVSQSGPICGCYYENVLDDGHSEFWDNIGPIN